MRVTLFLIVLSLLVIGCTNHLEKTITDKRYDYTLKASSNGIELTFTKMPNVNAFIKYAEVNKYVDKEVGETEYYKDCEKGKSIKKGKTIKFVKCLPTEPGDYLLRFQIEHTEPASYKPSSGESCLLMNNEWDCLLSGTAEFIIK